MKRFFLIILSCSAFSFSFAQNADYEKGLKALDAEEYTRAVKFLKPFAESGDAMAAFAVGYCYLNGDVKLKNDSLAELYLISAAEKYYSKAMGTLCMYLPLLQQALPHSDTALLSSGYWIH